MEIRGWLSDARERSHGMRAWESALLAALSGGAGLSIHDEGGAIYFDEIINAAKAHDGTVFDYSRRPVYYALNRLVWNVLGSDFASLRLLALLLFIVTGFLVYGAGRIAGGRACAWLGALGYLFSATVLTHGVRGMPHVPAGAALAWSLLFALLNRSPELTTRRAWWYGIGSGLAAVVAVGCHPTTIPFGIAIGLWSAGGLVKRVFKERWVLAAGDRAFGVLLGLSAGAIVLLGVMMLSGQDPYFTALLRGVEVVQTEGRFAFYHRPWYFYATNIFADPPLRALAGLALTVGVPAWLLAMKRVDQPRWNASPLAFPAFLLWSSLFSLVVLSLLSWKFERILVSYVPLLSVAMAATVATGIGRLATGRRVRLWLAGGCLAIVVPAAAAAVLHARDAVDRRAESRSTAPFYRLMELVETAAPEIGVGYMGSGQDLSRISITVRAADKQLVPLRRASDDPVEPRHLERQFFQNRLDLVVVNFPEAAAVRHEASWWEDLLTHSSFEEIFEHENRFELWRLRPRTSASELARRLGELGRGSQIAVLGRPEELGPALATWVEHLLAAQGLRGYRLWLVKKPSVQFGYVERKGLRHVLLIPTHLGGYDENFEDFRRLLIEAGARQLGTEPANSAELWEIDR